MENAKRILWEKVAKETYQIAKREAESACLCFYYQPIMPKAVKDLRKK